ncbi:MAG: ABC transporter substrate-binding protein [Planctomycetes bacterium]|nr:ABC transporter substrate-binding protein [Planctomycetota bacterium]
MIRVRRALALAGLWAVAALTAGCPGPDAALSGASPPQPGARVVSLAPNLTEMVYALGAGGRLVGATTWCDFPQEARSVPRVGSYNAPDLERVVAARPDLVLIPAEGEFGRAFHDRLRGLGLRVEVVRVGDLDGMLRALTEVGRLLGVQDDGEGLAGRLRVEVDAVARRLEGAEPVGALLAYDRDPLVCAGPGTFGDDILCRAGGRNLAGDAPVSYPRYGWEEVLRRAPAVVVDATQGSERDMEWWSRWDALPAVAAGRVHAVDPDLVSRAGPRLVAGLRQVAAWLHPERFAP